MFDSIYKIRYSKRQRRKWQDAADDTYKGRLADWIRDTLDAQAKRDLSTPAE